MILKEYGPRTAGWFFDFRSETCERVGSVVSANVVAELGFWRISRQELSQFSGILLEWRGQRLSIVAAAVFHKAVLGLKMKLKKNVAVIFLAYFLHSTQIVTNCWLCIGGPKYGGT